MSKLTASQITESADQPKGLAPTPTRTAKQSIIIERPLKDVFVLGLDLERRCQWQRDTVIGHLADPDVPQLGAKCVETRKIAGGAVEQWDLEIVEFEQDSLLVIRAECDCARVVERHSFGIEQPGPGRTRYTLALETTGLRWTSGDLQRQILDRLIHFRDCVETADTSSELARWRAARLRRKAEAEEAALAARDTDTEDVAPSDVATNMEGGLPIE